MYFNLIFFDNFFSKCYNKSMNILKKIIAFPFLLVLTIGALVTLLPTCTFIGLVGGIPITLMEWWTGENTGEGFSFFVASLSFFIEFIKVLWGIK